MNYFGMAIGLLLDMEGGYVNDWRDPGGETKYGISKRAYPTVNIGALTEADAALIYRRDYWDAMRCDDMAPALAICVFDCAVNQGKGAATKLLQRAVGAAVDGILGLDTIKRAANAQASQVDDFMARRAKRYAENAQVETYGLGWYRRLMRVHRVASTFQEGAPP